MQCDHYVIRGGVEGRERLRILSRVMRPTTLSLFDRVGIKEQTRVGIKEQMACLDVGCGGGDVTLDLAELVGSDGSVIGWDIDEIKLGLARHEAEEKGVGNVEFSIFDIGQSEAASEFDLVYTRFLLTHLRDPAGALSKIRQALRPGGIVIVEDIEITGYFCYPDSAALRRFIELYTLAVQRRGGDPNIGLQLPVLLLDAGFERMQANVVQPAGIEGEVKLLTAVTMENIADSVVTEGLAGRNEVDEVIARLYELALDSRTFLSVPRVVQAWGYRPLD
jgi:SAM-dependent methyltransferase